MPASAPATALHQVPSRFPALPALAFQIETPADFVTPPLPDDVPDFDDPCFLAPLWLASSPVALAVVTVAARPAYEDGSVFQWLRYLAIEAELELTSLMPGRLGPHSAAVATARQTQDGVPLHIDLTLLEDGATLFLVQSMLPASLRPSLGESLAAAVASFRLSQPRGHTHPLIPDGPIPKFGA